LKQKPLLIKILVLEKYQYVKS